MKHVLDYSIRGVDIANNQIIIKKYINKKLLY